jgi:hypothetical protein
LATAAAMGIANRFAAHNPNYTAVLRRVHGPDLFFNGECD